MIEAVVQTGSFETAYRRAGTGGSVLLLIGPTEVEAGDWLFGQLAMRYRTIAPVLPAGLAGRPEAAMAGNETDLESWLRGLIDGLGVDRPALVASIGRGAGLLRFMALDPERIGRLALIQPAGSDGVAPAHLVLDDPAPTEPHPVLVMGLPGPEDGDGRAMALDRLVRFLAGGP